MAYRRLRLDLATGNSTPETVPAPTLEQEPEWIAGPGGWALRNLASWGEVVLRAPDGTERKHGTGLIAGWTGEGRLLLVRWNAEQRRQRLGL